MDSDQFDDKEEEFSSEEYRERKSLLAIRNYSEEGDSVKSDFGIERDSYRKIEYNEYDEYDEESDKFQVWMEGYHSFCSQCPRESIEFEINDSISPNELEVMKKVFPYTLKQNDYNILISTENDQLKNRIIKDNLEEIKNAMKINIHILNKYRETNAITMWDIYAFINRLNFSLYDLKVELFKGTLKYYSENLIRKLANIAQIQKFKELDAISESKCKGYNFLRLPYEAVVICKLNPFTEFMNFLFECNQSHMYTLYKIKTFPIESYKFKNNNTINEPHNLVIDSPDELKNYALKKELTSRDFLFLLYGEFSNFQFDSSSLQFVVENVYGDRIILEGLLFLYRYNDFLICYFTYNKADGAAFPGKDLQNALFFAKNPTHFLVKNKNQTVPVHARLVLGINSDVIENWHGHPYGNIPLNENPERIYFIFLFYRLFIKLNPYLGVTMAEIIDNLITRNELFTNDIGKKFILNCLEAINSKDNLLIFRNVIENNDIEYQPSILFESILLKLDKLNLKRVLPIIRNTTLGSINFDDVNNNMLKLSENQKIIFIPIIDWVYSLRQPTNDNTKFILFLFGPTEYGKTYFWKYLIYLGFRCLFIPEGAKKIELNDDTDDLDFIIFDDISQTKFDVY